MGLCKRAETEKAMADGWGTLRLEVRHNEIVVTLPGSNYTVTYHKPPNSPQLLAKSFTRKDDGRVPMNCSEFLARAWKLANDKARTRLDRVKNKPERGRPLD
jgi:hypothetical protein